MVMEKPTAEGAPMTIPTRVGDAVEINYGGPAAPDFGPLARDKVPVRAMKEGDLVAMIAIDRQITGRDRSRYFKQKLQEALHESDVRVSLVAERDERPVGFIMARVDLGEFGRFEPTAVIDTIGVDVDCRGLGIGRALLSQLLVNLSTLRIERVRTEIDWRDRELLAFLDHCGFHPAQELCFERAIA
jgi:ribosomal protein S18 acetylase RimI-like enzyme